jgi:hypothetical protein
MTKTPQEKKRDSYTKDRRNAYGERGAHSRHSIRQRKREPNRANRRLATTLLATARGEVEVDDAGAIQSRIEGKNPKRWWWKTPDIPLKDWIEGRLRRRSRLGIDDLSTVESRLARMRERSK